MLQVHEEVSTMSTQATKEFSSYSFTPAVESPAPTPRQKLDEAIARLREGARAFVQLSIDGRIEIARSMQQGYLKVAERSVVAGCQAKGIAVDTPAAGEEWATGPWGVVRQLRLVRESLHALKNFGNTSIGPVARTIDGRLSVRVFPGNTIDGMLFKNVTVDVRTQSGVSEDALEATRASFYKKPNHDGHVVLVLGAGNIAAIPSMDVITKMFNEGKVCLLKMNPVNAYLGPFIEEAFHEAIAKNFLAVVYGGPEEGRYLAYHDGTDEIHITGSDKTHDNLVWGPPGPEREARMARNEPLLRKAITSELGNISPVILVPGPYSEKELSYQAEDCTGYATMNASFLCNSVKMLVTPKGWDGRSAFFRDIEAMLAKVPTRKAYYPGAADRWIALTQDRSNAIKLGEAREGTLPWTLIADLDPATADEPLFNTEPFCSILSETSVSSSDPIEFLDRAVDFVNERLWGTLSATLVVHPKSMKDPPVAAAVERAITRLRYGTVAVNAFHGLSFGFGQPPWGAYPGSTLKDIQSGRGWVHNTAMLEGIEKVVFRHPLTTFPKPSYFPTHRTVHKMMRKLTAMEEHASWAKVPAVVFAAMQG
jgi:acyl-CoA reductase-like NAD-dependent aldehyde dehydrogenase